MCVAAGWSSSSSSLKWSSGSLSSIVGLCRVGGPVPDLVNALDLSKNSVRALIPLWVPRMSGGYIGGEISSTDQCTCQLILHHQSPSTMSHVIYTCIKYVTQADLVSVDSSLDIKPSNQLQLFVCRVTIFGAD